MAQDKKDMLHYEHILKAQGYRYIAGVDEAGRGPLAGPVVAAAVILDPENVPADADDSKKLSASKRERLYDEIMQRALSVSVAVTGPERIDRINILRATLETMNSAISGLEITPDYILVDGNILPPGHKNAAAIVKGDALSASIACASIIAKVTRDRLMTELSEKYPQYGFEKHKGYGTHDHMQAIAEHGLCPIHRKSFCTRLRTPGTETSPVSMRKIGDKGEELAAAHVQGLGMEILERNFSCRLGEIDIVAKSGDTLVFIEVKSAANERFGPAESHVTLSKRKKLRRAAECYMKLHGITDTCVRFDCAAINRGVISYIKDAF